MLFPFTGTCIRRAFLQAWTFSNSHNSTMQLSTIFNNRIQELINYYMVQKNLWLTILIYFVSYIKNTATWLGKKLNQFWFFIKKNIFWFCKDFNLQTIAQKVCKKYISNRWFFLHFHIPLKWLAPRGRGEWWPWHVGNMLH